MSASAFSPYSSLAEQLLPYSMPSDDGGHDLSHIIRVFNNAMRIHAVEGGDGEVLVAAVLLHDCVAVEKNSPLRAEASRLAAEKAEGILREIGWADETIKSCCHAILTHSFSANLEPETLEAKILQDADRLDAIGVIGAARCFYTAGRMGGKIYHPTDPLGDSRPLDDKTYALDHFPLKLFRLADGFKTATGRQMAQLRHERLVSIRDMLLEEI
jgi:uncharacterized protein